jgi:polyketide cyclase/dehydrase/lipid transport protein
MTSRRLFKKIATAGFALVPTLAVADAQQVAVSVVADLPLDRAWSLLSDFSLPHNYVPGIIRTEIVSNKTSGVGAHRRVYSGEDSYLEETIIAWRDGEGFVIRLHQGDKPMMPFQRAEFSYAISPQNDSGTLIELAMVIEMPWGGFGEKLGDWVILPTMQDRLVQVAAGMKHFYETGVPATDGDRKRLADDVEIVTPGD